MIYTHALAALVAALLAAFSAWQVQGWRIERIEAEHAAAIAEADRKARERSVAMQESKDEAVRRANQRAIAHENAAAGARSELDRLRDDIAARNRAAPAGPAGTDAAETARALLAECAARYQDLAGKADRHANDAVTLRESWPR